MVSTDALAVWLARTLPVTPAATRFAGWQVRCIVITHEAAQAFNLEAAAAGGGEALLAGVPVPVHVTPAQARDVWVELSSPDGGDMDVCYLDLTVGLSAEGAAAYSGLRGNGYSAAEALEIAVAILGCVSDPAQRAGGMPAEDRACAAGCCAPAAAPTP